MTDPGRGVTAATQTAVPEPGAPPNAQAEAEPGAVPNAQAKAEPDAVPNAQAKAEPGAAAIGVIEPEPGAAPNAQAEPGAAPNAQAEPGAAPNAQAEPEPGAAPGPRAAAIVPVEPERKPKVTPVAAGPREQILRAVGVALILLGAFVLGFAVYLYGLSGVQEARSQSVLYQRLQGELANQVAPLGSAAPGAPAATPGSPGIPLATPGVPVAILRIPAIGVHDLVVVEGTSPEDLTLGPGHLNDTPLPGQAGVSEIFGRRATFGAPFARLAQLRPGDVIQVITGQGTSTYRVAAIGNSAYVINDLAPNRRTTSMSTPA